MPFHLPTTSPVAVAAARILAAYLSNHKLSPAEAASLGGTIIESLAALTRGADIASQTPLAVAEEPPTRREPKARAEREAPAKEEAPAEEPPAPPAALDAEPKPNPEPEPDDEPAAERDDGPAPLPEPIAVPQPEASVAAASADAPPRKRKRPSRPRSRRGKGAAYEASAPGAAFDEPLQDEASDSDPPDIDFFTAEAEIAVTSGDAGGTVAAEDAEATPKARRGTSRARRVTTA